MKVHGHLQIYGAFSDPRKIAHFTDTKASAIVGGTLTAATWNTRTLNTTNTNDISGCSLASNQVTLPAGTYTIEARCQGYRVDGHRARIYNVSSSAVVLQGLNADADNANAISTSAEVKCVVVFTASTVIRLEHYIVASVSTSDAGAPCSIAGVSEVYADLIIWKIV